MPTYVWRASHHPATLSLTAHTVRVDGPSSGDWPRADLGDAQVEIAILHKVPFPWWLELRAVAAHGPIPPS